jgi:hypothetical protein
MIRAQHQDRTTKDTKLKQTEASESLLRVFWVAVPEAHMRGPPVRQDRRGELGCCLVVALGLRFLCGSLVIFWKKRLTHANPGQPG